MAWVHPALFSSPKLPVKKRHFLVGRMGSTSLHSVAAQATIGWSHVALRPRGLFFCMRPINPTSLARPLR